MTSTDFFDAEGPLMQLPLTPLSWWLGGVVVAELLALALCLSVCRRRARRRAQAHMKTYQLKALRTQMNPHFLFNVLASIQLLINQEQTHQANQYLVRFGQLLRVILNYAEHTTVDIKTELLLLERYLELEALRFKFEYEVQASAELATADWRLPTLVLQPYLEHLVRTGLAKRQAQGRISVQLTREGDHLHCVMEDNIVVGCDQVPEPEALLLETAEVPYETSFTKECLSDAAGAVIGTRHEVRLPLLYQPARVAN